MNAMSKLATFAAIAASACALTSAANAAEESHIFQSVLSTPSASWCIAVPGGEYQAGKHLLIAACNGQPNQTFGYGDGANLTAGGYCLDRLAAKPDEPPGAGDPVVIAECNGSDHQIWELPPFKNRAGVFAIANPDSLCVTVEDETIKDGSPLVLAQCAELDPQGWVYGKMAAGPAPAPVVEEFYWYSGHRYCWYDRGWHGPGWYWCGENFHRGIGWGGPIGWHWWHHRGHPPRVYVRRPPHVVRHPPRVQRHPPRVTRHPPQRVHRQPQRVHRQPQRMHQQPQRVRKQPQRVHVKKQTTTHRTQVHRTQPRTTRQPTQRTRRNR
jgi:hypothetical protein